jgi:hypothetical protein
MECVEAHPSLEFACGWKIRARFDEARGGRGGGSASLTPLRTSHRVLRIAGMVSALEDEGSLLEGARLVKVTLYLQ